MNHNKRTDSGYDERLYLLNRHYPDSRLVVEQAMGQYRRKDVGRDDIVDALVGVITARNYHSLDSFPEIPEMDDHGLPMEIVYWLPDGVNTIPRVPNTV